MDQTLSRVDDGDTGEESARGPHLYLVLEGDRPWAGSTRHDLALVDTVTIGRGGERSYERSKDRANKERKLMVKVPDRRMSSAHLELRRLHGQWVAQDLESKNGAWLNGVPLQSSTLEDGDLLELGHTFFLFHSTRPRSVELPADIDSAGLSEPREELRTFAERLRQQFQILQRVGPSEISVLILGETGTGKEVMARVVHRASSRKGDFVAVNCGAIPQHLIEAELFGAKKGAYSGADQDRVGLVKAADRGTLFLDELGDLQESSQAALLRVLQEKEVMPVGGARPEPVDFRLVAATHRDLEDMVEQERFRGDLLARANGVTVRLSPLRERREDLGMLIGALLNRLTQGDPKRIRISPKAARVILTHEWPYNIRELEKCLETAIVLGGDEPIKIEHLPENMRHTSPRSKSRSTSKAPDLSAEDLEKRQELVELIEKHNGNLAAVARDTGKARMQIHRWIKRFRIDVGKYRT